MPANPVDWSFVLQSSPEKFREALRRCDPRSQHKWTADVFALLLDLPKGKFEALFTSYSTQVGSRKTQDYGLHNTAFESYFEEHTTHLEPNLRSQLRAKIRKRFNDGIYSRNRKTRQKKKNIPTPGDDSTRVLPVSLPVEPQETSYRHCVDEIYWVSVVDYSSYQGPYFEDFTIPKPKLGEHTLQSQCPYFTAASFDKLRWLGKGFAFYGPQPRLHQSIVMMEILKLMYKRKVTYLTISTAKYHLLDMRLNNRSQGKGLVYIDFDSSIECQERVTQLSQLLATQPGHELLLFPSEEELSWYNSKVYDIMDLDKIARDFRYRGEEHLGFRPTTCFGDAGIACPIPDQKTVLKGSHSSETRDVTVLEKSHDCPLRAYSHTIRKYFHQEYISSFLKIGELRVIIVTVPDEYGVRGRSPRIVNSTHTSFKGLRAREPFLRVSGCESFWSEIAPLTKGNLETAAIMHFTALRKSENWRKRPWMELGARLDMAVSEEAVHRFFVNEFTDLKQGVWFSTSTAKPYFEVPAEVARALNELFPPIASEL